MEFPSLLFGHSPLHVTGLCITPGLVTLIAAPVAGFGCCPSCGVRSSRVHSHYCRRLHDLPAHGRPFCLELHLRRFFCDLADCPRKTFAERLPQVAQSYARKTCRLVDALQETAFTAGGEAGSRLAGQLGMPSSPDTLLRLLRRAVPPSLAGNPRVLGVDDWAMRKGQTYGTILCDLESHRPVDLLPERTSDSFAAWLAQHPGTQIISRDRGGDYAHGAAVGAPDAVQVADRWHLLHNLTDALQRAVDHRQRLLGEVSKEVAAALAPTPLPVTTGVASLTTWMQRVLKDAARCMLRARDELHYARLLRMMPSPASRRRARRKARWCPLQVHSRVLHRLRKLRVAFHHL